MYEDEDVPKRILDRLRSICRDLPESYEEPAWVGVRWRIRKRTFVHVRTLPAAELSALPRAMARDDLVTLMTFRAAGEEFGALTTMGYPFWRAGWGTDVVGMAFTPAVDWTEVAELLTESYRILAPRKLARLVE